MVGYRNDAAGLPVGAGEVISHSDGGVSEQAGDGGLQPGGGYQSFRWWGIGTEREAIIAASMRLSVIPMVGYRNLGIEAVRWACEVISHSDGGVSEHWRGSRWPLPRRLSVIPMVGYRNIATHMDQITLEVISHSDGGVSERRCTVGSPGR